MSQTNEPTSPAESVGPTPPDFASGIAPTPAAAPAVAPVPALAPVVAPEAVERIERLVGECLTAVSTQPVGSPEFARTVDAIDHLGERDFIATSAMSGRVLDRRFGAMNGLLAVKAPLGRQLADLRKSAAKLDPATIKLGSRRSAHDEVAEIDRYFERFSKAQPHLESLLASLAEGRLGLEQDNAAILNEQASLATEMETLRQYAFLAGRLDEELTARISGAGDGRAVALAAERVNALRLDVLPIVRRRRREILTQLSIVMQGYAALRIVEDDNAEVIRAVASTITTTTAALRTAVMVANAAASHRLALEQLDAARLAASALSGHAAALEVGVTGPEGRVAMLREAWGEVYAALDRVDAQKAQALRAIAQADRELTRPK